MSPIPLTSRPLALFYTSFFALHIPTFFLVDSQTLYSDAYRPRPLKWMLEWYLDTYNDPILGGALGEWSSHHGGESSLFLRLGLDKG